MFQANRLIPVLLTLSLISSSALTIAAEQPLENAPDKLIQKHEKELKPAIEDTEKLLKLLQESYADIKTVTEELQEIDDELKESEEERLHPAIEELSIRLKETADKLGGETLPTAEELKTRLKAILNQPENTTGEE